MYYSWMGLCSGHGHSVVIRELSLYPQSLLAKLTVLANLCKGPEIGAMTGSLQKSILSRPRVVYIMINKDRNIYDIFPAVTTVLGMTMCTNVAVRHAINARLGA